MPIWKRKKHGEYERMARLIQQHPGLSPAELARRLGVSRSTVLRRLPTLEALGYLLYEDERGRLFFWRRIS